MIKQFFPKNVISNPLKKGAKTHAKKSLKFFTFITVCMIPFMAFINGEKNCFAYMNTFC
jgi:hypothetical protein